jgi:hypothetical protein
LEIPSATDAGSSELAFYQGTIYEWMSPAGLLLNAVPGPNFSISIMPLTSEQAALASAASGQITLIQTGVVIPGSGLGPAR